MKESSERESEKSRQREKVQNSMHTNGMLTRYVCLTVVCAPSLVSAYDDGVGTRSACLCVRVYVSVLAEEPTPAGRDVPPRDPQILSSQ